MAGLWIGRLKRSFNSIKDEVARELGADEIRQQLHNEKILELEREMQKNLQSTVTEESSTKAAPSSAATNQSADKQP
jgi:sec-independent protein translocase protein TatB